MILCACGANLTISSFFPLRVGMKELNRRLKNSYTLVLFLNLGHVFSEVIFTSFLHCYVRGVGLCTS